MLIETYEPKIIKEIIGNSLGISKIRDFLKNWKKGTALFFYGPTGSGKTLTIRLLAKEMNYQLIESHATDDRSYKNSGSLISSSKQRSIIANKKMFLIDELEQIDSVKMLSSLITESEFPVILIGENPYDKKFFSIRKYLKIIKFQKPSDSEIAKFLTNVCKKEGIELEAGDINQLARMCGGDIRAALIDLDIFKALKGRNLTDIGHREQTYDIFNLLKLLFRATSIENAKRALERCEDPEKLIAWLAENIANEFQNIKEIASAYNYLSKADLFSSRIIKRQAWGLQRYYFELSTLGMAQNKKSSAFAKFIKYEPPKFYFNNTGGTVLEKIGKGMHISKKRSKEYIPIIRMLMKGNNKKETINEFGFDENDAEILS